MFVNISVRMVSPRSKPAADSLAEKWVSNCSLCYEGFKDIICRLSNVSLSCLQNTAGYYLCLLAAFLGLPGFFV
jgi:hypothetical protein